MGRDRNSAAKARGLCKYINFEAATIAALRDYGNQKFIYDTKGAEKEQIRSRLESVPTTPSIRAGSGENSYLRLKEPVGGSKDAGDTLVNEITQLIYADLAYETAATIINALDNALNQLSEEERFMLQVKYMEDRENEDAVNRIMNRLNISKREAQRRTRKTLKKLTELLYNP